MVKSFLRRGDSRSSSASTRARVRHRSHRREAAIQEWCVTHEYPAPEVLAVFGPGELLDLPVQVMQRGPDSTLLDAVKRAPWRAPALVDRLASLHLRLHGLPTADWPEPDGEGLAERRLRLVRRFLATHDDAPLSAALAAGRTVAPRARSRAQSRMSR